MNTDVDTQIQYFMCPISKYTEVLREHDSVIWSRFYKR